MKHVGKVKRVTAVYLGWVNIIWEENKIRLLWGILRSKCGSMRGEGMTAAVEGSKTWMTPDPSVVISLSTGGCCLDQTTKRGHREASLQVGGCYGLQSVVNESPEREREREKVSERGEQARTDVGVWASLSGMIRFHSEERRSQRTAKGNRGSSISKEDRRGRNVSCCVYRRHVVVSRNVF